ncbi:MAG TPA: GNAT family N-acetyltransferase [Chitinophagaceae bacterium]|nr:GNAT family N-acetyltransferase [Chitinophagaceae bacterium]
MKDAPGILLTFAESPQQFADAEALFKEYAASLDIDLSFQGFANELATIRQQYYKPHGALLLCYIDNTAVACTAIRKFDEDIAELKRMFVQPAARGHKIAQKMLALALDTAKNLGYTAIRLDTLPTMQQAQCLYVAQGFYEIPAYRYNPVEGTIFMEKKL